MRTKTKPTKPTAEQTFVANILEARRLLAEIQTAVDDHLGVDPESINWGHAGDAERLVAWLEIARGATR